MKKYKIIETSRRLFSVLFLLVFLFSAGIPELSAGSGNSFTGQGGEKLPEEILFGIPAESDQVITRKGFSLGYSYKYRQAVWVAYILTEENLQMKKVKRISSFRVDPAVRYAPVRPKDYAKTGYDKGHLAPAADMAWSLHTMKNSFFMSNITPQTAGCNRGIWKRLEKNIRKWAVREKKLCIVTGPIFSNTDRKMGNTSIPVPAAFYKVIYDMTEPVKMIAFIIPNASSKKRIFSFAVPVDSVEEVTGYDFFTTLDDELEEKLEKECNIIQWLN